MGVSDQHVVLDDQEWDALTDTTYDPEEDAHKCTSLPVCCGVVSDLRQKIITLRNNNGSLTPRLKTELESSYEIMQEYHGLDEWDSSILVKLMTQVDAISP